MSTVLRTAKQMRTPAAATCAALVLLGALAYARSGATAQVGANAAGGAGGVPPARNPDSDHTRPSGTTTGNAMPSTPGVSGGGPNQSRQQGGERRSHGKATGAVMVPSVPPAATNSADGDKYWTPEKMANAQPARPGVSH